jgi:hypothetical protein
MKTPKHIQQLIGEIMEQFPQAEIDFEPLPSGVCWLNVWLGRRNFEMECHPTQGTGVSENFDDTPPFIGHDAAFDSFADAANHFKSLLADATRTEAEHLPQAFALHDKKI